MSRYATATLAPPEPTREGDNSFTGLNMKAPRETLPAGILARAENNRFIRGAESRRGTRTPAWANTGIPTDQQLKGAGLYSDPNGAEMLLLAHPDAVYAVSSGSPVLTIAIPEGTTLNEAVTFSQHFDKVLLHRSDPSVPTLIWDGASAAAGFVELDASPDLGPGIVQIPNSPWSVPFQSRNCFPVPGEPDAIGMSDINDYDVWDSELHKFRVNLGTADKIVGIYRYSENTLIIGKSRSIDRLANIPDDLGDSFFIALELGLAPASAQRPRVDEVSDGIGFAARKCTVRVGSDLLFLSDAGDGGIYRITPSGDKLVVDPTPVSDAILPLIQRINWAQAYRSCAALDGIYAKFAVPIDGSVGPNCLLVLNTATGQWQGIDLWNRASMEIDELCLLDYFGTARLFAVSLPGVKVRLLDEGLDDQMTPSPDPNATYAITHLIETRGYATLGAEASSRRDFKRLEISLGTFSPSVLVSMLLDDHDERPMNTVAIAPDRLQYRAWGVAPFDRTNTAQTFSLPGRLDYAVHLGDTVKLGALGIPLFRFAPSVLRWTLGARARFLSARITNTSGAMQVHTVFAESTGLSRAGRRGM